MHGISKIKHTKKNTLGLMKHSKHMKDFSFMHNEQFLRIEIPDRNNTSLCKTIMETRKTMRMDDDP